jgi:hypothetical protein
VLTVEVEMNQDRVQEELLVEPVWPYHVVPDESLELATKRHQVVRGEGNQIEDLVSLEVDEDEVAKEGDQVVNVDNLTY